MRYTNRRFRKGGNWFGFGVGSEAKSQTLKILNNLIDNLPHNPAAIAAIQLRLKVSNNVAKMILRMGKPFISYYINHSIGVQKLDDLFDRAESGDIDGVADEMTNLIMEKAQSFAKLKTILSIAKTTLRVNEETIKEYIKGILVELITEGVEQLKKLKKKLPTPSPADKLQEGDAATPMEQ
jgi:hypothetical protein